MAAWRPPIALWSMLMTLSNGQPSNGAAWQNSGIVQLARSGRVENAIDQATLSGPADSGDTGEQADRNLGIDIVEVIGRCALDLDDRFSIERALFLGCLDLALTRKVLPG